MTLNKGQLNFITIHNSSFKIIIIPEVIREPQSFQRQNEKKEHKTLPLFKKPQIDKRHIISLSLYVCVHLPYE